MACSAFSPIFENIFESFSNINKQLMIIHTTKLQALIEMNGNPKFGMVNLLQT